MVDSWHLRKRKLSCVFLMRMFLALEITCGNVAVNVLEAPKAQVWLQISWRGGYANRLRQQRLNMEAHYRA